jgi:hypothetical protein
MERVLCGRLAGGEIGGRGAQVTEQVKPASEVLTVLGHGKEGGSA